jgi:surfeit locus 1 family protein
VSRTGAGWRFWLITLATAVGIATTASLGAWQLSRAAGKEALQAQIDAQRRLPPLEADALHKGAPLHRAVVVRGHWLADHTVFLDNRQMNGKPGFFVLTPLQIEGSAAVVVVQRGWIPRNFGDRAALPRVQTPAGEVEVHGRITGRPPRAYALGKEAGGPIRQNLDLDAFRRETGLPLADVVVRQTGGPSEGLERDWPEPATGIDTHYGYAFQWFGLCALIGALFLWFQVVRPFYRSPRA